MAAKKYRELGEEEKLTWANRAREINLDGDGFIEDAKERTTSVRNLYKTIHACVSSEDTMNCL